MELRGRALYNLLRISWLENPKVRVKSWQVEDYRCLSIDQLLSKLKELGIVLDQKSFEVYAENCESPEDLVEYLSADEEDADKQDAAYLVLFELWRRLLPYKQSLSVFCDELDELIERYDQEGLNEEEVLQKNLKDLEDILDETADLSGSAEKIFEDLSQFCAHDLHGFLYDYISDQIEIGEETYASELINAFYEFLPDKKWFDLLKARLFASMDMEELNPVAERLFDQLLDHSDLDLLFEVAKCFACRSDIPLFMQAAHRAISLIKTEEQLQELLALVAEHYRYLDRDEEEKSIRELIQKRKGKDFESLLDPLDPVLHFVLDMVT